MKTGLIVVLVIAVVAVAGGAYLLLREKPASLTENGIDEETQEPVFCTQDAMECPDGSFVGRIAPDCEFAPCPDADCAKQGEGVKTSGKDGSYLSKHCCPGLSPIDNTIDPDNCDLRRDVDYDSVCVDCGDGICGLGENKCNCPEDCQD